MQARCSTAFAVEHEGYAPSTAPAFSAKSGAKTFENGVEMVRREDFRMARVGVRAILSDYKNKKIQNENFVLDFLFEVNGKKDLVCREGGMAVGQLVKRKGDPVTAI